MTSQGVRGGGEGDDLGRLRDRALRVMEIKDPWIAAMTLASVVASLIETLAVVGVVAVQAEESE